MKGIFNIFIFLATTVCFSQNPEGFTEMCDQTIKGTVPYASIDDLKKMSESNQVFILDTREVEEYQVSHIKGAINVGYDDFNLNAMNGIPKDARIYVYCSIGYRSDDIGSRLIQAGYKNVFNVFGGIFSWFNHGYPLYNDKKQTDKIHGYNEEWSKWLNPAKGKIILK